MALSIKNDEADRLARELTELTGESLTEAASLVESGIVVLSRYGEAGGRKLEELLRDSSTEVVPVTAEHARLALEGFVRFSKGRHPARLNFGDCLSYALAMASGHGLLFKGDDFSRTDVEVALPLPPTAPRT